MKSLGNYNVSANRTISFFSIFMLIAAFGTLMLIRLNSARNIAESFASQEHMGQLHGMLSSSNISDYLRH